MLSKMLALTAKLQNKIGNHNLRFNVDNEGVTICVISEKISVKGRRYFSRVFSKEEIDNVFNESFIIEEFIEDASHCMNIEDEGGTGV